jgi:hypothetical protein
MGEKGGFCKVCFIRIERKEGTKIVAHMCSRKGPFFGTTLLPFCSNERNLKLESISNTTQISNTYSKLN